MTALQQALVKLVDQGRITATYSGAGGFEKFVFTPEEHRDAVENRPYIAQEIIYTAVKP